LKVCFVTKICILKEFWNAGTNKEETMDRNMENQIGENTEKLWGIVAHIWKIRNACNILVGKPQEKIPLGRHRHR
jgi:hypothetical protein